MIESIIIGFLTAIVFVLLAMYLKLRKTYGELVNEYLQQGLSMGALQNKIGELIKEVEQKKLEKSDGFVKFLSDSREWAFEYIENLQSVIKKLNLAVSNKEPKAVLNQIYKELQEFLPTEEEEKR